LFLVSADVGGDGFEAVAELVELGGEAGEGELLPGGVAVAVDDRAELAAAVEGGAADPGAVGNASEGDRLSAAGEIGAGLPDALELVVVLHPA
jgi:hypothetical protein